LLPRMERDSITFAVQHNGTKAVGPNWVPRLKHFSSVWNNCRHGFIQSAVAVQIKEGPMLRGAIVVVFSPWDKASAHSVFLMGQHGKRHSRVLLFVDGGAQDGGIEAHRAIQVDNWHVEPNGGVGDHFGGLIVL